MPSRHMVVGTENANASLPLMHAHGSVVHVHVAKMAGRTIMDDFPRLAGMPKCKWQPPLFFGNTVRFVGLLQEHCGAQACFSSYEGDWDDMLVACRQASLHGNWTKVQLGSAALPPAPPIFVTMLRSSISWAHSALTQAGLMHSAMKTANHSQRFAEWKRTGSTDIFYNLSLDEALLPANDPAGGTKEGREAWDSWWYGTDFPLRRLTSLARVLQDRAGAEERARHNLQEGAFGVVERMEDSMLLLLYQVGQPAAAATFCASNSSNQVDNHGGSHPRLAISGSDAAQEELRRRLARYERVYEFGVRLFEQRVARVRRILCSSFRP